MAFTTLASRLNDLPLVLAGPILRQVTKDSVTVWVALLVSVDVTLNIYDHDSTPPITSTPLLSATRNTTAIGANLHMVAVTASKKDVFSENKVYFYDLVFSSTGPPLRQTLAQGITPRAPAKAKALTYPGRSLPNFALAPGDLNHLRLVHGSCRKPQGGNPTHADALALLDDLIADNLDDPLARPHQLLLTGDQIYADEVIEVLLVALTDAGDTLLGWAPAENLPGVGIAPGFTAASLPPSMRSGVVKGAGLTSEDTRSHLLSLGEYLAMYLFTWSEVLWPDLPPPAQFNQLAPGNQIPDNELEIGGLNCFGFLQTIPKVRRAMAHVPTYMICDDHDVTDDWNMTRRFADQVYGTKLGQRIIQNALIAYSLCQAWGNLPQQFAKDVQQPPGLQLLNELETISKTPASASAQYSSNTKLATLVGVHDNTKVTSGVFHDAGTPITIDGVKMNNASLRYHYSIEGKSHQIIVTDTRSWRGFPSADLDAAPDLLPGAVLDAQLNQDIPALNGRLLIVVLTTNAPPIALERVSNRLPGTTSRIYKDDLFDNWFFPSRAFDTLIVKLSDKLGTGKNLSGSVIFLSGDIHYSFSSRLAYRAEIQRLGDVSTAKKTVQMVVAQLVCSSLKNQDPKKVQMQDVGYMFDAHHAGVDLVRDEPEGHVGWNLASNAPSMKVGGLSSGLITPGLTFKVDGTDPTLIQPFYINNDFTLDQLPDYRYRLDYLQTVAVGQTVAPASGGFTVNPGDLPGTARTFAKAAALHIDVEDKGAKRPEVIGYNNLGDISFVWPAAGSANQDDKHVIHKVRWEQRGSNDPFFAVYDVSLNSKDTHYPPIKAKKE